MKRDRFIIDFGDDQIEVFADSKRDAKILAKAERINQGKHKNIESVKNVTTDSIFRVI